MPRQARQSRELREHPLAPEPSDVRPLTMLTGYLGRSNRQGYWRLYSSTSFDEYVEFAEDDVERSEQLPDEHGGTRVWLRQGAALSHVRVTTRQLQADFLRGGITDRFLPAAAPTTGFASPARLARCASIRGCDPASEVLCRTENLNETMNPHIPMCQSAGFGCGPASIGCGPATGAICPTGAFVCGATVGCTVGRECSIGC